MFGISRAEYDEALDRIQDLRERVWAIEQREHQREADADHNEEARDLAELLTIAQGRIEDLEKQNAALEQSLKDARRNRDEWRQAAKSFDQIANEAKAAAYRMAKEIQDREKEIRLLQDEIAKLEGRLSEARVYSQQQKVEDAAAAVLNAAMIGDQNFIGCLCGDHAAELRAALVQLQEIIRDA